MAGSYLEFWCAVKEKTESFRGKRANCLESTRRDRVRVVHEAEEKADLAPKGMTRQLAFMPSQFTRRPEVRSGSTIVGLFRWCSLLRSLPGGLFLQRYGIGLILRRLLIQRRDQFAAQCRNTNLAFADDLLGAEGATKSFWLALLSDRSVELSSEMPANKPRERE